MKKRYKIVWVIVFGVVFNFSCVWARKVFHSRDPFYLEEKNKLKKVDKADEGKPQRSRQFFLEGVMEIGKKLAAVVSDGQESSIVVTGDHVDGYLVNEIDGRSVVLIQGKKTKRLELD